MARVKFYHKINGNSGSVWVRLSLGRYIESESEKTYTPLRLPTGITGIKPQQWDKDLGRVVARTDKPKNKEKLEGAVYINGVLDRAEARIMELTQKAVSENRNNAEIKTLYLTDTELSTILGRQARKITASILDDAAVFLFIEKKLIEDSLVSAATKKAYKYTLGRMKELEELRNKPTTWLGMDIDYYNDFVRYLYSVGLGKNTVGNQVKQIKKFLNSAIENKIPVSQDFRDNKNFSKPKEPTLSIYLTEKELDRIEKLNYTNNPRLDKVRDLFLIGCNTALRISDLKYLKAEHIQSDRIKITTKKTGVEVVIPILPQLKRVLKKNEGKIPEAISDQKYNDYLKEVGEDAKITDLITIDNREEGTTKQVIKKDLITSHTARRTYATNQYRRGIPIAQIMPITGHKTAESFMRYIKVSNDENADDFIKQDKKLKQK